MSLVAPKNNFVIIESRASQRKVETAVSFANYQRNYETDAVQKKSKYQENTFIFMNKFLGALEGQEESFEISRKYYEQYIYEFNKENKKAEFLLKDFTFTSTQSNQENVYSSAKTQNEDEKLRFQVEEIVAMLLKYGKNLAEKMSGIKDITKCVITVPCHWNISQRNALQSSAALAGLDVLSLINENSAAALYYGRDRNDEDRTHLALFYNIGAYNLQVSLVEYSAIKGKSETIEVVRVLADTGISNVGGKHYDLILAEHFADEIDSLEERKGKKSIREDPSTMLKLIHECKKVKEVLSANKDAVINIVGLYENQDFISKVSREVFLEKSGFLLDQLVPPVKEIMERAGKKVEQIDQVEILGGGIRIPRIQEILKEYLGEQVVGSHMNGDESMAHGAAFYAATLSKTIKSKQILLSDGLNQKFNIQIRNMPRVKKDDDNYIFIDEELFATKRRFGQTQAYNFKTLTNLKVTINSQDVWGNEYEFASYNITGIAKTKNHQNYNATYQKYPNTTLEFELNSLKGVFLQSSSCNFNFTKAVKVPNNKKQPKDTSPVEGAKNHTIKYKKTLQNMPLDVKSKFADIQPWSKSEVIKMRRQMRKIETLEQKQQNLGSNKNKLEQLIYESRDKLEDSQFKKYSTEEERTAIQELVQRFKEWVEQDIQHSQAQIKMKLRQLEEKVNPIKKRQEQVQERPKAIAEANKKIGELKGKMDNLKKSHPWITDEQKQGAYTRINQTENWLQSNIEKQMAQPANEDPIFWAEDIKPKLDQLLEEFNKVRSIKKPKKEEKKSDL